MNYPYAPYNLITKCAIPECKDEKAPGRQRCYDHCSELDSPKPDKALEQLRRDIASRVAAAERAEMRAVSDVLNRVTWDVELRKGADSWSHHGRRKALVEAGEELGRLCKGNQLLLARTKSITFERLPAEALALNNPVAYGRAYPDEHRFVLREGLSQEQSRETMVHEIGHVLWPLTCNAKDDGEDVVRAFAAAFVRAGG